ncbi:MAG: MarR family transcriptional regulator [Actinomycetota bacterium]|nr:MarR family transcriptional regulator [Actinomycetota bacterium]
MSSRTTAPKQPRSEITDPVDWARHYWRKQGLGGGEDAFIAMSSVLRFHRLMTESVEEELKKHKLNLTDYMLLMTLQLSETGTRLISKLARNLLVHATTATLATDRLEARGLLERAPHPTDRRATLVSITDDGRKLVQSASHALDELDFGLAGTSNADRAELVEVLARLRAASGDQDR